jgi:hypothetical protein
MTVIGPDPRDVEEVTTLFDLMQDFPSNEERARFLLSSNWMRQRAGQLIALGEARARSAEAAR